MHKCQVFSRILADNNINNAIFDKGIIRMKKTIFLALSVLIIGSACSTTHNITVKSESSSGAAAVTKSRVKTTPVYVSKHPKCRPGDVVRDGRDCE